MQTPNRDENSLNICTTFHRRVASFISSVRQQSNLLIRFLSVTLILHISSLHIVQQYSKQPNTRFAQQTLSQLIYWLQTDLHESGAGNYQYLLFLFYFNLDELVIRIFETPTRSNVHILDLYSMILCKSEYIGSTMMQTPIHECRLAANQRHPIIRSLFHFTSTLMKWICLFEAVASMSFATMATSTSKKWHNKFYFWQFDRRHVSIESRKK